MDIGDSFHAAQVTSPVTEDAPSLESNASLQESTLSDTKVFFEGSEIYAEARDVFEGPPAKQDHSELGWRATDQGTWLEGDPLELENLQDYEAGGLHPVCIGDFLDQENRYCVMHKLGYGGFSTVWLCRDYKESKFVAIKVCAASVTPDQLWELHLAELPGTESAHINIPLDHFSLTGPNGAHQCLVNQVLGQRVHRIPLKHLNDPVVTLKNICRQATTAMKFLHANGICHGDFRPSNILLKLESLDHMSEDEMFELVGYPWKQAVSVVRLNDEPLPVGTPNYLFYPIDPQRFEGYFTSGISVIDFGESFLASNPPEFLGTGLPYRAPEFYFEEENPPTGKASDLWALGCTIYAIRYQTDFFEMVCNEVNVIQDTVARLGRPLDRWWMKWTEVTAAEDGKPTYGNETGPTKQLDDVLGYPLTFWHDPPSGENFKTEIIATPEERLAMKEMLLKLLRYEPSERISAEEVLKLEWLREEPDSEASSDHGKVEKVDGLEDMYPGAEPKHIIRAIQATNIAVR